MTSIIFTEFLLSTVSLMCSSVGRHSENWRAAWCSLCWQWYMFLFGFIYFRHSQVFVNIHRTAKSRYFIRDTIDVMMTAAFFFVYLFRYFSYFRWFLNSWHCIHQNIFFYGSFRGILFVLIYNFEHRGRTAEIFGTWSICEMLRRSKGTGWLFDENFRDMMQYVIFNHQFKLYSVERIGKISEDLINSAALHSEDLINSATLHHPRWSRSSTSPLPGSRVHCNPVLMRKTRARPRVQHSRKPASNDLSGASPYVAANLVRPDSPSPRVGLHKHLQLVTWALPARATSDGDARGRSVLLHVRRQVALAGRDHADQTLRLILTHFLFAISGRRSTRRRRTTRE